MRITPIFYVLIAILLFSLVFGLDSLSQPSLKTKLLPLVLSCIIFILTAVQLIRELLAKNQAGRETEPKNDLTAEEPKSSLRQNITGYVWLISMALAIYLFGFLISIPVFVFLYLKLHGYGWLMSAAQAAAAVTLTYIIFVLALHSDLYSGLIFN